MPCLLEKRETVIVRGKPRNPPVGPVGEWIDENLDRRGWGVRTLAEIAGVSSPRVTQLRQGDGTTRDMIERLAAAFLNTESEASTRHRILNAGLQAAGFATEEIIYTRNPDTARIAERYDNASYRIQKIVEAILADDDEDVAPVRPRHKSAAELAAELDRENSLGKRAE